MMKYEPIIPPSKAEDFQSFQYFFSFHLLCLKSNTWVTFFQKSKRSYNKCNDFSYQTAHFQMLLFQKQQDNSIMKVFFDFNSFSCYGRQSAGQ